MKEFRIGLLGLGQIGSGVYQLLNEKKSYLAKKTGRTFSIQKIAVKNLNKKRSVKIPKSLLTARPQEILHNPDIDCVVELIGGDKVAKTFVLGALRNGKSVVTANKALIALHGKQIFKTAQQFKQQVYYEASVGGGVPVIKALREGMISNRIQSVFGIINGTCNAILSRMTRDEMPFREALQWAKEKGYAEPDPTFDIDGIDSAHKLAILASLCFGKPVSFKEILCEGIRGIDRTDIEFAKQFGYVIKSLAVAKSNAGILEARVQPTLLTKDHILANVEGAYNAVLFRGDEVGDMLLYGQGAGPSPTASAVVSDLVDLATGHAVPGSPWLASGEAHVKPAGTIQSRYYLRFSVIDKPGVLGRISSILGKHRVSISDMIQSEQNEGDLVPLIMLTHRTHHKSVQDAIKKITSLAITRGVPQVIRIEEG